MATPLVNIENGILSGDWLLVCQGFNKLTGKKISPPASPKVESGFDPETAPKKDLYKFMKDRIDVGPIKDYTVADLREMVAIHAMGETEDDYIEPVIDDRYVTIEPFKPPIKKDGGFINPFKKDGNDILPNGGKFLDGFRYHSGRNKLLPIDRIKVKATVDPQLVKVGDPTADYTPREPTERVENKCMKCSKKFKTYKGIGVEVDGELKSLCPICSEQV